MAPIARGLLAPLVAVAVVACGSTASGSSTTAGGSARSTASGGVAAAVTRADRTHEYRTPAGRQAVAGGWRSPLEAIRVFADTYINWTARTVSVRLRALAEVSIGQARSAMTLASAEAARDYELHRGGIANSGIVEAVAPLRGRPGRYAVVTLERTTATDSAAYRGLRPAWHVTVATVARVSGGLWVLSGWQPES